jgi:hypothetical protein
VRRSPVAVGLVLGLVVGAGAAVAIAATSSNTPSHVAVLHPTPSNPSGPPESDPAPGSIERLAAAFDMHGAVATDSGGWIVRDGDRFLRVQRIAGLPWFFSTIDRSCTIVPEGPPLSEPLQTVPPTGPTECPEAMPPGVGVSQDDAFALGTDTLSRAGLGASTTEIVDEPGGWYIQASPQIDGKATTSLPWTISIGPGPTVTAASGYLAVEVR